MDGWTTHLKSPEPVSAKVASLFSLADHTAPLCPVGLFLLGAESQAFECVIPSRRTRPLRQTFEGADPVARLPVPQHGLLVVAGAVGEEVADIRTESDTTQNGDVQPTQPTRAPTPFSPDEEDAVVRRRAVVQPGQRPRVARAHDGDLLLGLHPRSLALASFGSASSFVLRLARGSPHASPLAHAQRRSLLLLPPPPRFRCRRPPPLLLVVSSPLALAASSNRVGGWVGTCACVDASIAGKGARSANELYPGTSFRSRRVHRWTRMDRIGRRQTHNTWGLCGARASRICIQCSLRRLSRRYR